MIENSLGALRAFYRLGVRYMTLAHFANTDWADSATDEVVSDGLSSFGEDVVREMNRLGMLVDLSHVSPATMSDALDVAVAPVIFSHSGARALTDHVRNVPDSILARLPENGGLVMQVFYPPYVSEAYRLYDERSQQEAQVNIQQRFGNDQERIERELERWRSENPPPVSAIGDVADHIEHIRDVAGIDHVGLGSDFDGIPTYVTRPGGRLHVSCATRRALPSRVVRRRFEKSGRREFAAGHAGCRGRSEPVAAESRMR